MSLGVDLLHLFYVDFFELFGCVDWCFFIKSGKFSSVISLNIFFSLLLPVMHMLVCLSGIPHFSEALFISSHYVFLVFFRLHNLYWSIFMLTDFFCQLKSIIEPLQWIFCFAYYTFQLQNFHFLKTISISLLTFCTSWVLIIIPPLLLKHSFLWLLTHTYNSCFEVFLKCVQLLDPFKSSLYCLIFFHVCESHMPDSLHVLKFFFLLLQIGHFGWYIVATLYTESPPALSLLVVTVVCLDTGLFVEFLTNSVKSTSWFVCRVCIFWCLCSDFSFS